MRILSFLILFLTLNSYIFGQTYINGYVTDKGGEALVGANIFISELNKGTTTDAYGYYNLLCEVSDSVTFQISYIGYTTSYHKFFFSKDTSINFQLSIHSFDEIVVTAESFETNLPKLGTVNIPIQQLKQIPTLAGEVDIIKALSFTPGVVNGTEGSSSLFVRGGDPGQNLILLDDAVVYNPNHLFGFLSVFNPDAVKSVSLIKSGFPAQYGGRLSSVLDITTKEGNLQEFKGQFSMGLLSSKLTLEGPIIKDKMSYMVSGRSAYLSLFLLPVKIAYNNRNITETMNYFMTDSNIKLNYKPNDKNRFFFSFYTGDDTYRSFSFQEGNTANTYDEYIFDLGWGNTTASLRHTSILSKKLFLKNTFTFSNYKYGFSGIEKNVESMESKTTESINQSALQNFTLKSTLSYYINPKHQIIAGLQLGNTLFTPEQVKLQQNDLTTSGKNQSYPTQNMAIFLEDNWDISSKLTLNSGIRYALFNTDGTTYHSFEPRLTATYQPSSSINFQVSYSKMWQPIHLLPTQNTLQLTNDLWIPSTSNIEPQIAHHFGIGANKKIDALKLNVGIEFYYKKLNNVVAFKEGNRTLFDPEQNWEDFIETNGTGTSYGIEVMTTKTVGKLTGILAYTYSKHTRQFENINLGNAFPFRYDYRHDFSITSAYSLNKNWNFSASWVYRSGQPFTQPISVIYDNNGRIYNIFGPRNAERLPAYHRGDIMASHSKKTKRNNLRTWSFSIYNFYYRKNIYDVRLIASGNPFNSEVTQELKTFTLLPILPSVSYSLSF